MDGSELKLMDKLCEICSRKNEKVIAVSWCFECQEAICEGCIGSHKVIKGLEHHQIESLDKLKKEKVMHIPTVDIYCPKHKDRKLEIYCHDHQAICCLTCMTMNHRKCNQVTTVDEAAGEIKQIAKDEKLGERIKQLSVQMRERADDCEQNMEELTSQKLQIETAISDEKRKIIQMFEALEKNDLSQLNKMHKETLQNLQERRVRYENRAKILEQCHASLDNNLKHFTDLQTCIELVRIKRQLTEHEQYMISVADTVDQRYQYNFTISPSIINMASIFTTYGDITRCIKIRQPVLANTFSVDVQSNAFVSDGVYFSNQKIILTVYSASEWLVYDITGARQSVIKLDLYGTG
ncbi:hypothetical protein KUTeg_009738 [Tegillarca granosa]|uniref:B box-type domain-containing protein n=1 Tax=Tegillarca granosa TaxID=220873 RepID=A0ABQ9F4R9_TEGGR|nr:hypothetical protein KUTeg_009738 [Tegillarca granosa]